MKGFHGAALTVVLPAPIGLGRAVPCSAYSKMYPSFFGHGLLIVLMMEAVSCPETLPSMCQTTQCIIPQDSHFHARQENLKFQLKIDNIFI
jgi:hypothetical protein